MEFKWVIIVDKYGRKSNPVLQYRRVYREDMFAEWQDIPIVEIKPYERDE